jgi:peptidoglycan hydrolase-like protein with peptidoglycan-binding domain
VTGKREQIHRSNHEGHKKHLSGTLEARAETEHNNAEKFSSLQTRLGNRVVSQLFERNRSSGIGTSARIYRQTVASSDLPLEKGSRGPAVVAIQEALLRAGYALGKFGADGIFGRLTRRAIERFQRDNNLPDTRMVDTQTYTALMQAPPAQASSKQGVPSAPPATMPGSGEGEFERVDMGPKRSGRAYMLDWDSKHKQIEQNKTLREAFVANLAMQLASVFGEAVTQDEVLRRIEAAEAAGKVAEAEQMRVKLRIANQYAVVNTLKVQESDRYAPTDTSTYCNIYAYDVVTAMGGYLPRVWWRDKALTRIRKGEKVKPIYDETIHELNANALTDWMYEQGGGYHNCARGSQSGKVGHSSRRKL